MLYINVSRDREGTLHATVREHETSRAACAGHDAADWRPKRRGEQINCDRCFELVEAALIDNCERTWGDA